jgi:hypothetical protein
VTCPDRPSRWRGGIASALGVYAVWVIVTYLLEGVPGTLRRPEAEALRFVYTVVANVLVGTVVAMLLLRRLITADVVTAHAAGFGRATRRVAGVAIALVIGGSGYVLQGAPSLHPVVMLNGFAQTLPVSAAEVLVCWSLVGAVSDAALRRRLRPVTASIGAALVASLLFGVYHIAHSPPFNSVGMIVLLSAAGLATSLYFRLSGDVYATIVFHNFLALLGVLRALAASGGIDHYTRARIPLLLTAVVPVVLLALMRRGIHDDRR